jgi:hypothetical protein
MGILSKITGNRTPEQAPQVTNELSKEELELLLRIMGNADLKGREVEFFYTMVLKLQNQYLLKQQQQ